MRSRSWMLAAFVAGLVAVVVGTQLGRAGPAAEALPEQGRYPVFEVDPSWPAELPYNWIVGHVPGVAVDSNDHVFVLTRPNTLAPEDRARAAPAVLEFDPDGNFVNGWGGHGMPGVDWPDSEHGISVDYRNNVWVGGSAPVAPSLRRLNDDMLLKFTSDGELLMQIGGRDASPGSQDPPVPGGNRDTKSFHQPTDAFVYEPTNEVFVTDGYGNRRVIVLDADNGEFKRLWGAFGNEPIDVLPGSAAQASALAGYGPGGAGTAPAPGAAPASTAAEPADGEDPGPPQFGSPVHGVKVSNDGLVYVADRQNRRVQVFTVAGEYVTQVFLNRVGMASGSAAGLAFSPDPEQRFLYVADYGNSRIAVFDRRTLEELYQFGQRTANPGDFQGLHHMAVDSRGNIYTGEVAPGARMQRFLYRGTSDTLPPNAVSQ